VLLSLVTTELITELSAIFGLATAIGTATIWLYQYRLQGKHKRAEFFIEMRRRLKENETFKEICFLLETDDQKLKDVPFKEKRDFVGFFEEVALLLNSGLIPKKVAHNFFGYYALSCDRSENFWDGISRESIYWDMFNRFAAEMEKVEVDALKKDTLGKIRF
jgi:hypothetical protein